MQLQSIRTVNLFNNQKLLCALNLVLVLEGTGCSEYQKALKSPDYKLKRQVALKLYQKEDYKRALPLIEELLTITRGTSEAEKFYYYYARCHFGIKDYETAQYYFENFLGTFPTSGFAEDAAFMSAYSLYLLSPRYDLDASSTQKAIQELQYFINRYPKSNRITECNALIDELRGKLEKKYYRAAILYFNMEYYQAAIVALKNFLKDFPDSRYQEEAHFYVLKSAHLYAQKSVEQKKAERFEEVVKFYHTFAEKFPGSRFIPEANYIYKSALNYLKTTSKKTELRIP
ncbi:MAG: outer membrane protein assembly factor BamD [Flavobacteriales bacterium]|nr:outer membrane protein assembly factor BamD [Flavobacteriales bacterium]MCX7767514.1 outer membrane protein assembly factor BamD [Flavobacteriales bacterium]MDW8409649.1 outer membrane protein assembly factor BamD [Flavobacteriales bacterium]